LTVWYVLAYTVAPAVSGASNSAVYEAPDLEGVAGLEPREPVPFAEPTSNHVAPGDTVPVAVRLPTHAPESIVGMPSNVTDELALPLEKRTTSPASSGPA
jgi:hypothetical protein